MSLLKNDPKYNEVAYITFITQDGEARDADYPIGGSVSYNAKFEKYIRSNSSGAIGLYDEAVSSVRLMGVYAPVNRGEIRGIAVLYHSKPFLDTLKSEYEKFFSDTPANYVYVCKYPDEVEAVAIIDGTEIQEVSPETQDDEDTAELRLYYRLDKLGLGGTGNLLLKRFLPEKEWLSEDEQKAEYALALMTYDSRALLSESEQEIRNINTAWEAIVTNDIPKIYISTAYFTAEDIEADGILTDEMIDDLMNDRRSLKAELEKQYQNGEIPKEVYDELLPELPNSQEESRQMAMEDYLAYGRDYKERILLSYFEKLGHCEMINLPGDHLIYEQKPDECGQIISDFIEKLK